MYGGTVVNIGSVSSFIGQQRTPAYMPCRGGVLLLSKALALDLARDGIRYLSNDQSSGVTGASLVVDGGYTAAAEWSQGSSQIPGQRAPRFAMHSPSGA